jgi:hypothetical protein
MAKRPIASDRVIAALRARFLAQGFIDVTKDASGRLRPVWQHGRQYGPMYQPTSKPIRMKIHPGRGRPPAGSIGLVAAIALAAGCARYAVHRALASAPRAGSLPPPVHECPMCGRAHASSQPKTPELDLSAIGLKAVPNTTQRIADQSTIIRGALEEALMAALGSQVLTGQARDTARALLEQLGA